MPNRLSHRRPLDLQLRPDSDAEAVFDQIVTTPWGRALLHPHCPPAGLSHAFYAVKSREYVSQTYLSVQKFAIKRYVSLGLFSCRRSLLSVISLYGASARLLL